MKRATVWKFLRRLGCGLLGLILLAALILTEEYYRGKWAWEQYQREATARGVSFDPRPFIPPPVPDEQNFAMTPLLKPLFGKDGRAYSYALSERLKLTSPKANAKEIGLGGMRNGKRANLGKWREYLGNPDVLEALKKFAPELDEISKASRQPFARFPIRYEDELFTRVPHLTPLMNLSKLYTLRALSFLDAGQTDSAFADVESIFRLADSVGNEPLEHSQVVRTILFTMGLQVVWEGVESHRWSESQLAALQGRLERIDLLNSVLRAFHYERASEPAAMRQFLEPKTFDMYALSHPSWTNEWVRLFLKTRQYQAMLESDRFDAAYLIPVIDPIMHRVNAVVSNAGKQKVDMLHDTWSVFTFLKSRGMLCACAAPALDFPPFTEFAHTQNTIDQTLIACALERYRLAHGEFPETLDALVPQYVAKLPHDIINGQPLHYRRMPDSLYLLYSVGWNETDDNGITALVKNTNRQDIQQGDWVWRQTTPLDK